MSEQQSDDEASDSHLELLALLLPLIALIRARLNAHWPDALGSVPMSKLSAQGPEVTQIILKGLDNPSVDVVQAVRSASDLLKEQVTRARVLLASANTATQAQQSVQALEYGVHRVERLNAWAEVRNQADNIVRSLESDEKAVWVPERDACVHCLAYAGIARRTSGFPGGLTYGDKPISNEHIENPPLHPNCRCELRVVSKSNKDVQQGLIREAQRSIVRGFSLASEPESLRLRATKSLLSKGVNLPDSVKKYGQRSVNVGGYPRGRDVPN
jgi:hypothetical protein